MASEPIKLFNPWESETMHSYRVFLEETGSELADPVAPPAIPCVETVSNTSLCDEEGWVLVKEDEIKSAKSADLRKEKRVVAKAKKKSSEARGPKFITRELTDTAFRDKFKKPLAHAFGRGNTKPVVDSNMLKTFNVRAAETGENAVFPSAMRALEEIRKGNHKRRSKLVRGRKPKQKSKQRSVPTKVKAEADDVIISCEGPCGAGPASSTQFQKRATERVKAPPPPLSMFELLRWEDSLTSLTTPTNFEIGDGRPPAGCKSKKSEPVSNLLCWGL